MRADENNRQPSKFASQKAKKRDFQKTMSMLSYSPTKQKFLSSRSEILMVSCLSALNDFFSMAQKRQKEADDKAM